MIQVGKQIQKILAQKPDFNLAKLAKLARVSPSRLSKIANQHVHPSMAELERLADALGVKPSSLVEEEEAPPSVDSGLVKLLANPTLASSLWTFSQLSDVDQQMVVQLIKRFAQNEENLTRP